MIINKLSKRMKNKKVGCVNTLLDMFLIAKHHAIRRKMLHGGLVVSRRHRTFQSSLPHRQTSRGRPPRHCAASHGNCKWW